MPPQERNLLTCKQCGYEWFQKSRPPKTCANKKCRTKAWNRKPKPVGRPATKKSKAANDAYYTPQRIAEAFGVKLPTTPASL
jgi:hypothetical protein